MFIFEFIIEIIATLIGVFGAAVIVVGVFKAGKIYLEQKHDLFFKHSRLELSQHLILGLDFLVAKDVLDSLAVRSDTMVLINLAVLIGLRILLTHFVNKELDEIRTVRTSNHKKSRKKNMPKKNKKTPAEPKIIA